MVVGGQWLGNMNWRYFPNPNVILSFPNKLGTGDWGSLVIALVNSNPQLPEWLGQLVKGSASS